MKVEPVSRLQQLQRLASSRPDDRPTARALALGFEGPGGKSQEALRKAAERGVGAEHKQAHSRRFGALLDEEA